MPWLCASGEELTHSRLLELLSYNPMTGDFIRKVSTAPRAMRGAIAGDVDSKGYWRLRIDGKRYLAYRVAGFWMTGKWPSDEVDHKNRVRVDNRWDNLRLADTFQNKRNTSVYRNNRAGLKGAYLTVGGRYTTRIRIDGKNLHLGTFDTPEEAHALYVVKSKEHFGEFARAA